MVQFDSGDLAGKDEPLICADCVSLICADQRHRRQRKSAVHPSRQGELNDYLGGPFVDTSSITLLVLRLAWLDKTASIYRTIGFRNLLL